MDLLLTHRTALAFWRNSIALGAAALARRNGTAQCAPASAPGFALETIRKITCDSGPVHILINSAGKRGRHRDVVCHVRSADLPRGCICEIGRFDNLDVCIVSPEICLIEMLGELDDIDAMQIGFEFCGTYRTHVSTPSAQITRYNVNRLCTSESLTETTLALAGAPYTRKAAHICNRVLNGSASPAETALALLLTLPNSSGGYGLPQPLLNVEKTAALPFMEMRASDNKGSYERATRIFRSDLYWPGPNVAVEYDSREFHSDPEAITSNAIRYNDLQALDCTAFIATAGQLRSLRESDRLALQIGRALGVRKRIRCKDFREKQLRLRQKLGFASSRP